jgi:hypothetical protein
VQGSNIRQARLRASIAIFHTIYQRTVFQLLVRSEEWLVLASLRNINLSLILNPLFQFLLCHSTSIFDIKYSIFDICIHLFPCHSTSIFDIQYSIFDICIHFLDSHGRCAPSEWQHFLCIVAGTASHAPTNTIMLFQFLLSPVPWHLSPIYWG